VALKLTADLNHRWHEKYLLADGKAVVVGGMNVADEYMKGGTDQTADVMGHQKPVWRDTDVYIAGPAAAEAYNKFARNWKTVSGQDLPAPPSPELVAVDTANGGGTEVQIIQHRPRQDGDHHIENLMIENIKALQAGEKCWIANAYFLPTGALEGFKEALMDAAKRGVDVRILTNSEATNDLPQMNQAALPAYRDLLDAGVRIMERTDRTMHQKVALFGNNTAVVGSWNADNRSASLHSEVVAVVYGEAFAQKMEAMILKDMDASLVKQVTLADTVIPMDQALKYTAVSLFSNLL
jgi:cardiolipin synthase